MDREFDATRDDFEWLIRNVGVSARPMVEIARFILVHISRQMTAINELRKEGTEPSKADLTNSLLITKRVLVEKFGSKAEAFIRKFSTPVTDRIGVKPRKHAFADRGM